MPSLSTLLLPYVQFFVPPHTLSHHTVNVVTLWKILGCHKRGITSIISITLSSAFLNSCSSYCPIQPLECEFQSTFPHHLSLSGKLTRPVCLPMASLEFQSINFPLLLMQARVLLISTRCLHFILEAF